MQRRGQGREEEGQAKGVEKVEMDEEQEEELELSYRHSTQSRCLHRAAFGPRCRPQLQPVIESHSPTRDLLPLVGCILVVQTGKLYK